MGFSLTEDSHQNLEKLIVSNTCGGPSIVFTRYHEAGKTRLRELVSETEPDGAVTILTANLSECQMGLPNYVRACWGTTRTHYIRGANPALTCGALCALRSGPDPPRRMVQTDSGQQEVQPAANELLPQTRRYEAQVEYRFGGENWALFCGRFLARRAENHRTGRMSLARMLAGVKNTGMTSRESVTRGL